MAELKGSPGPRLGGAEQKQKTIEDWLGDPFFRSSIETILPRHLTGERFAGIALRQFKAIPGLRECTPASVLAGMIDAAQLGLEIGLGGECWLIPYNVKVGRDRWEMQAQLQIGYLGHLKLAWQSGMVASIEANVATHDEVAAGRFEFQHGTAAFLHHRPIFDRVVTEKTIAYAYAVVWIKGSDRPIWTVLDAKQIERLRNTGRSANSPAWSNWYDQQSMAKALKRALKWAPKARELAHAIAMDDEGDAGAPQTYQSGADVAGLLSASGVRSPEDEETAREMDRLNRTKPGVGANDQPGQGSEDSPGTVPPAPKDNREPVPVAARKAPAAKPEGGGLGF